MPSAPGLYFVGLVGQYSLSSDVLPGASRDPRFITKVIAGEGTVDRIPHAEPSAA